MIFNRRRRQTIWRRQSKHARNHYSKYIHQRFTGAVCYFGSCAVQCDSITAAV